MSSCPFCAKFSLIAIWLDEGGSIGIGASSSISPWDEMSVRLNSILFWLHLGTSEGWVKVLSRLFWCSES